MTTVQVPEERGAFWGAVGIWGVFGYFALLQNGMTLPRLVSYVVVLGLLAFVTHRLHRSGLVVDDQGVKVRRVRSDLVVKWHEVERFERVRSLVGPVAGVRLKSGKLVKCLGVAGGSFVDRDIPREFVRALAMVEKQRATYSE